MPVGNVNNNNNSRPSIVPAMVIGGAGVGAVTGYNSKPFYKGEAMDDTFVSRLAEVQQKVNVKYAEKNLNSVNKQLEEITKGGEVDKLSENVKRVFIRAVEEATGKDIKKVSQNDLKSIAQGLIEENNFQIEYSKKFPFPMQELTAKRLKGIYIPDDATLDEVKTIFKDNAQLLEIVPGKDETVETVVDRMLKNVSVAEVKQEIKARTKFSEHQVQRAKDSAISTFDIFYGTQNKFTLPAGADDEIKEAFNVFKKETKVLQRKTALGYGAMGAALLGLSAFIYERFLSK